MTSPKIVVVGHVCIDHNMSEHASYTSWGSGALYMASYVQNALHLAPIVLTTYGPDLTPYVPDFHLSPSHPSATKTLVYKNLTKYGERIQRCQNAEQALAPALDVEAKRLLANADIVVMATLLPNYTTAYVRELLTAASPESLKVCCPQGYFRHIEADGSITPRDFSEVNELLPLFDLTFLSEDDHPRARQLALQWKSASPEVEIVVTEGPRGASLATLKGLRNVPTVPLHEAQVVDSVGCGDVFAMAATYHFYVSHNIATAVRHANAAARAKLLTTPNASTTTIGAL